MPRDLIEFPEVVAPVDVGAERLRILADFLETQVPAERFDMKSWTRDSIDAQDETGLECGTAACACGWATAIPRLHADGLHLIPDRYDEGSDADIAFDDLHGWDAIQAFFAIGKKVSYHLFDDSHYWDDNGEAFAPTPAQVAARIRGYLVRRAAKA